MEIDVLPNHKASGLPAGTTVGQAKVAAETQATALVVKYAGGPTQAEAVGQIIGTLGSIVQDGHIFPVAAAPAANGVMAELASVRASIAAQSKDVPTPIIPPAPALAAGMAG